MYDNKLFFQSERLMFIYLSNAKNILYVQHIKIISNALYCFNGACILYYCYGNKKKGCNNKFLTVTCILFLGTICFIFCVTNIINVRLYNIISFVTLNVFISNAIYIFYVEHTKNIRNVFYYFIVTLIIL